MEMELKEDLQALYMKTFVTDNEKGSMIKTSDGDVYFISNNLYQGSKSMTSSENVTFDPKSIMEWDEGIGTLDGSGLKFKMLPHGELEMVDEEDIEKVKEEWRKKNNKSEKDSIDTPTSNDDALKCQEILDGPDTSDRKESIPPSHPPTPLVTNNKSPPSSSVPIEKKVTTLDPDSRKCQNCGTIGPVHKFIRAGKFCSQDCATAQSSHLRLLAKRPIILGGKDVNVRCESLLKPEVKKEPLTPDTSMTHEKMVLGRGSQKRKQKVMNGSSKFSRTSSPSSTTSSLTQLAQIGGDSIIQSKKVTSNGVPHSPSSSEKNSRPSSPSSLGNLQPQTALHQSIFAMRVIQHQQEPPIGWDRHSKNLTSSLEPNKAAEIISWEPDRVAQFVNQIPGCDEMGSRFSDQLIDGEAFLLMTQKDIVETLKVKLGPAVKIYNSILLIRDGMEA